MGSVIRFFFLSSLVTPALIAASCSSLNKSDQLSAKQENLLDAFKSAKNLEASDAAGSCSLYTRLSTEEDFNLKKIAQLKAHLICPNPETLDPISENFVSKEPWLTALDIERQIVEAEKAKNHFELAKVLLRKAQWSDRIREKVQILQEALKALAKVDSRKNSDALALKKDLQNRLYRLAPRFLPEPTPKEYYQVGSDLIFQRQFERGRSYLLKIMRGKKFSFDEKYLANRAYRNSFKIEQNKVRYLKEASKFAKMIEKKASPAKVFEAYVILARAEWTEGHVKAAHKALNKAEKLGRGKVLLDEVYFVRAKMAEEKHDTELAISLLKKSELETKEKSSFRPKILFEKAWLLIKQRKYAEAADSLKTLKAESIDPYDRNRYSFWLARSYKESNQQKAADEELKDLTESDPLGYYGMLAYREGNLEIPALVENSLPESGSWKKPFSVGSDVHSMIRALTVVDEPEILEKYLDDKTSDLKSGGREKDSDVWLYFLKAYARAGLFNPLFQQLGGLSNGFKSKLLRQNPDLLFPRKYLEIIQVAGDKFKVKPELILSIIRQESSFNPHARSPADAMGLMQIMPDVAKSQAKKVKRKAAHFEDLFDPEVNIPLGASLLSKLQTKYRGQFVLTAAAYNASERAIRGWINTRLNDDPLEFIEDIPYEETRAYVKLVLRNFIFYSRLSEPLKPMAFPNWCLEDLQSFKVSTR
jgi:soluble lytic murein transglycosylase